VKITESKILALVAKGEGANLAIWPTMPSEDEIARTLCAFANTRGGWLVVGVGSRRPNLDEQNPALDKRHITLVAQEDLKPPIEMAIGQVHSARSVGGYLLAVQVAGSDDRPHSVPGSGKAKREIMVRVGTANHVAEGATLNAMRSQRTSGKPKDALEQKILDWMTKRARRAGASDQDATPLEFSQAAKVGLRRASKAFIHMEREGLLMGRGERNDRMYALP